MLLVIVSLEYWPVNIYLIGLLTEICIEIALSSYTLLLQELLIDLLRILRNCMMLRADKTDVLIRTELGIEITRVLTKVFLLCMTLAIVV